MVIKNVQFYNNEIERLKTSIKRLRAEKRVAILIEREREAAEQVCDIEKSNEQQPD